MKQATGRIVPTPDQFLSASLKKTPLYIRWTFCSAVLLGLVVHLYAFTNKLVNHDDIAYLFRMEYGTASGRWLLPSVLKLDGDFSMPWLIGILSILCLAGTVCLSVSLLRIRRPLACVIAAALMVSFPSVTATFSYMFTADGYFFGMLLAALGAYLTVRFQYGALPGAVLIVLSMGIYQSYFCVAAVLMVGSLIFEVLDGQRSFGALLLKGLKLAGTLLVSLGIYMLIVRFTTRTVELTEYMGISDMGKLSLSDLPRLIAASYGKYYLFFLQDKSNLHFGFLPYVFILIALCTLSLAVGLLWRKKLGAPRTILAVVLALLYPLAGNLIYIMVPDSDTIHALMIYGLCFILLVPLALVEYTAEDAPQLSSRVQSGRAVMCWVIILSLVLTSYSFTVLANKSYLKMDLGYRQCYAYSARLLSAVEQYDGYDSEMPVMLVGSDRAEAALDPTPQVNEIQLTGVFSLAALRTCYAYGMFLKNYLGFPNPVFLGRQDETKRFAEIAEISAMPRYPQDGSIRIIDGTMVVKLN